MEAMIITVSGQIGAGKSTLCKALAKQFGYEYISTGQLFRRMAADRNLSLMEFTEMAERNISIDLELDKRTKELLAKRDNIILDGRLAGYFARAREDGLGEPNFRVYLYADQHTRATRVCERENSPNIQIVLQNILERDFSEAKRFKDLYGADINDLRCYNFCLDTSDMDKQKVFDLVCYQFTRWGLDRGVVF